ncbi:MAG: alpha/beta fold hydrolase [Ignavibacteriaceae bacterium]
MKKNNLVFSIILLFSSILYSQSGLQIGEIGNFKLANGDTIYNCKIGYRLFGKMNENKSNIILFPTWFGGTTKGLMNLIGPNKLIDSAKFYVIAVDALGDGISSSPSNSDQQPGSKFPVFNIEDMVNSQYKLLTEILHIDHVYAVLGGSMGGMQTFQWMVSYPDFMDKAIPYVGSPKLTSYDLLLLNTELNIIELGHKYNAGDEELIKSLAGLQALQAHTPAYIVENIRPEDYYEFERKTNNNFKEFFNSYNRASQIKAMLQMDISKNFEGSMERAAQNIKTRVLIIVSKRDHIVNPKPAMDFGKMINAETFIFKNNCGHLSPGCDMKKFVEVVNNFLSE